MLIINDAMELKRQLYSIEGQVNDVKRHLHHLQECDEMVDAAEYDRCS